MMMRAVCVALGLLTAASNSWLGAEVSLAPAFGDHMLLQRDWGTKLWGTADPGAAIIAHLAGQERFAKATADGKWSVTFAAIPAGGPHQLTVKKTGVGADEQLVVSDVLMGDLWICSGQSNMAWPVGGSRNAKEEIASANYPSIRIVSVPQGTALEPQEKLNVTWAAVTPNTIGSFSAVGYFFGRELNQQTRVPIGLINTSWGATSCEAWTPLEAMADHADLKVIADRKAQYVADYTKLMTQYEEAMAAYPAQKAAAEAAGQKIPPAPAKPSEPGKNPHLPGALWNAMVHPLVGLNVKGTIWYQGEMNAGRAAQYEILLPEMIKSWRKAFGDEMPFYIVQLSNWRDEGQKLGDSPWAELREAQARVAKTVGHSGLAVTVDIGDPNDIHPKNKQDVGRRLGLLALKRDYGKDLNDSGPILNGVQFIGGKAIVAFDNAKGLVAKGETLEGFIIAGPDRQFFPARAMVDGTRVVVWADKVSHPASVRYGWMMSPVCNLYNEAGLPAVPFRSDDWPRVTQNNK